MTVLLAILLVSIASATIPSINAATYHWYKSTRQYSYGSSFPYRYVFYSAPYYYYVQDTVGNLQSQVQTLQSQLQSSQSDRDQAIAQAQQLSAQIDSLNQQVNDLNMQMNNLNSQYQSQISNVQNNNQALQGQVSNLQNGNQALQANLDAVRTQNNIMLLALVILGACVIGLLVTRRNPSTRLYRSSRSPYPPPTAPRKMYRAPPNNDVEIINDSDVEIL